ncbi:MAG TPA: hypothetical protein VFS38_04215 [Actinomycetota bacterium]|nr:hypothetical protein [Actinomycetota bacterium]
MVELQAQDERMADVLAEEKPPGIKEFGTGFLRSMAVGVLPGAAAGLVAGGVGSRLAMRVMAVTSSATVQGTETEFGATVGEITFEGTLFLLIAGAGLGGAGGLLFMAIRGLLPWKGWAAGFAFGLLLLATFGRLIIDPDNFDFDVLDPAALAVAMFGAIFVVYGLLLVPLLDRLEPSIRRAPAWLWLPLLGITVLPLLLTGIGSVAVLAAILIGYGVAGLGGWKRLAQSRAAVGAARALIALIFMLGGWGVLSATLEIV